MKTESAKYRKKPVVIEAYQTDKEVIIHTLEGDMKADIGDYIITGIKGEKYPCKPDIFEQSYERAEQPELTPAEKLLWIAENRTSVTVQKLYGAGYQVSFSTQNNNFNFLKDTLPELISTAYEWAKRMEVESENLH